MCIINKNDIFNQIFSTFFCYLFFFYHPLLFALWLLGKIVIFYIAIKVWLGCLTHNQRMPFSYYFSHKKTATIEIFKPVIVTTQINLHKK